MSTQYNMVRDLNCNPGVLGYGNQFSQEGQSVLLPVNTVKTFTVPTTNKKWLVEFSYSYGATVWVDPTNTPSIPTSTVASTTAEINPNARYVSGGQTLNCITNTVGGAYVNVKYYIVDSEGK